jgi:NADH-quinone oxidoreductase subunit E
MLPALHMAQDALGYVSLRAMRDIAELLELPPSSVMDVVSFYTHFWTHPRGEKTIVLCRSLTCELMGGNEVLAALQEKLGIGDHETTPDGKWSLMTEECLAACDHAPCMQINEKLHKCVKVADLDRILADADNDKLEMPRSDLFDAPK